MRSSVEVGLGSERLYRSGAFADSLDPRGGGLDSWHGGLRCIFAGSAHDPVRRRDSFSLSFASHLGCIFAGSVPRRPCLRSPCSIGLAPAVGVVIARSWVVGRPRC